MTSLRAGISGCSPASLELVQRARLHEDCEVVAVHDDDEAKARAFAAEARLGFATADFAALLGSGIDFVVLTGPHPTRQARIEAAAAQSAHVLVASPLAPDLATARAIVRTCEAAEVRLGVMVPEFADPIFEQLRRMISHDWLGGVVAVQGILGDDAALRGSDPDSYHPFVELASRQLQLTRWLTSRRAVSVTAQTTRTFGRHDDGGAATVVLRGGIPGTFAVSHATTVRAFAIHGTDGGIRVAGDRLWLRGRREFRGEIFAYTHPGQELALSRAELQPELTAHAPAAELIGRFARWLDERDDYPCPGDEALADFAVVDAMLRAARSQRTEAIA